MTTETTTDRGDDAIAQLGAIELAALVRAGELTAERITRASLARIDRHDSALGAFLHVDSEGALSQASAVDAARERGDSLGPLAGVPVALKDNLVTRGVPTTAGSQILRDWIPPYDATAVQRLRAAGAVIVGKTNCDEFAMGSSNENSGYFPCKNPWNTSTVPGGSSGGSAAAVAARLVPLALGTDTGGSIRQPAALCGVVGLKPTYGRVSRYGAIAFASSLDQIGPLARSTADTALALDVISGFDSRDSTSLDIEPTRAHPGASAPPDLSGVRFGIPTEYLAQLTNSDVRAAFDAACDTLAGLGATTTEISLPNSRYGLAAYYIIAPAEASSNLARYDGVRFGRRAEGDDGDLARMYKRTRGELLGAEVKRRIMLGTFALRSGYYDQYYGVAQRTRALIKADFDSAFEQVDVVLSPTSPVPAFELGARARPIDMYAADVFTLGCNLAGLPGISVPCGFTGSGLPVGLQMLAPALRETELLGAAAAYENARGPEPAPPGYGDDG